MTVRDFKKVKKFFDNWDDMREIPIYQVEEKFIKHSDTYETKKIDVDIEDGCLWFEDIDDVILKKPNTCMKGFLISSAELVDFYKDQFSIRLKDGVIKVKLIA